MASEGEMMVIASQECESLPSEHGEGSTESSQWSLKASLNRLADTGVERHYRSGTVLINEGDEGGSLFLIREGAVQAYVQGPAGRVLTLSTYRAGEYVGEMALDGGPRSASIVTIESTTCSVISPVALRAHIHREPDFAIDLIMRLIQRTRIATESARGLALLDVYGRVRKLLQDESERDEGTGELVVKNITHQDIANRIGASREMISKILKELSHGGYISTGRRQITLLKALPAGF